MRYIERLERIIRDQKKAELLAYATVTNLSDKHFDQALQSWDRAFVRMLARRNG